MDTSSKFSKYINIQDKVDAHDYTPRDTYENEECGQGIVKLELYPGEKQCVWQFWQ